MTTPVEIADFLRKLPHVTKAEPLSVEICGIVYPAAAYVQRLDTPEGSPAYARGERRYLRQAVYVAGMLPRDYCHNTRCVFRFPQSMAAPPRDWYIACYFGDLKRHRQAVAQPSEFHPFGNSFILMPWDLANPIDAHERFQKPRKRIPVSVYTWEG